MNTMLTSIPTEFLIEELKSRYESMILVAVLVNEATAKFGGAHICHWKGPSAQVIGLTVLASDHLRKQYAMGTPPPLSGNPYG